MNAITYNSVHRQQERRMQRSQVHGEGSLPIRRPDAARGKVIPDRRTGAARRSVFEDPEPTGFVTFDESHHVS